MTSLGYRLGLFIVLAINYYIYIIKTQLLCVCLSGLYQRDGGIKTALIIEVETNQHKV